MMNDERCTIVTSKGGDRWVHLPASGRVFYDYVSDGEPQGWGEASVSWVAMSKRMHYVESERANQPLPADLRRYLERQARESTSKKPAGEFMTVGPDGELSDLQMHAELLQEDDLLEAAEDERKRWAARRKEIARERKARRRSRR